MLKINTCAKLLQKTFARNKKIVYKECNRQKQKYFFVEEVITHGKEEEKGCKAQDCTQDQKAQSCKAKDQAPPLGINQEELYMQLFLIYENIF